MKGRLSRKRARVSLALLATGVLLMLGGGVLGKTILPVMLCVLGGAAVVFVSACLTKQACPNCGKLLAGIPRWSSPWEWHCVHCGFKPEYDDESEEG